MTNDLYVGAPEIRRRFQISPPTLRRWIRRGAFPSPDLHIARRDKWLLSTITSFEAGRHHLTPAS